MRSCINCNSTTTYIDKTGRHHWRKHKDGYLCKKCYARLFDNPKYNPVTRKKWNPINNPINSPKRLLFQNKSILLESNPRTGICSLCGKKIGDEYINARRKRVKVRKTHIHHKQYHPEDPLKDTVELCDSCHKKTHWNMILNPLS